MCDSENKRGNGSYGTKSTKNPIIINIIVILISI